MTETKWDRKRLETKKTRKENININKPEPETGAESGTGDENAKIEGENESISPQEFLKEGRRRNDERRRRASCK
jgi:hypothetical protein